MVSTTGDGHCMDGSSSTVVAVDPVLTVVGFSVDDQKDLRC